MSQKEQRTERSRLYADERDAMLGLAVLTEIAYDARDKLWRRAGKVPGLRRKLGLLRWLLSDITDAVADTVPVEQLVSYKHNLDSMVYTIGVRNPCMKGKNRSDDYGLWLSFSQLNTLFTAVTESKCLVCSEEQEYKCPIRKLLDELGGEVEHDGGKCGYKFV